MAIDPKIANQISEDLKNLENIIDDVAVSLQGKLNASLSNTKDEVNDITKAFKEGKDITKELESNIKRLDKESGKLALDRKSTEAQLKQLIEENNRGYVKGFNKKKETIEQQLKEINAQLKLNEATGAYLNFLKEENDQRAKSSKLVEAAKTQFKEMVKPLTELFTVAGFLKAIVEAADQFDKASVNISKNLGYSAGRANDVARSLYSISLDSGSTSANFKKLVEASNQLAETTGYVMDYSNMNADKVRDILGTQVMLTRQMGLTGEEAAHIYEMSVLTGKSSEQVNKEMVKAFVTTRNATKAGVSMKQTFAEASKVTGQLQANFRGNPALITEAIVKTKALGTTLEQTAKQGEKLLDFESSLESELKAELLTGKQLNLERARAAALAGDQVTLAEELAKNIGTYDDFSKMNVLQQKALADSMGMTTDELANQLKKQKMAEEQGKTIQQITEEDALNAQKRQSIQDRFNDTVDKLKDIIGSIGVLLAPVAQLFSFIADNTWIIYTALAVKLLSSLPSLVGGFKNMAGSIGNMGRGALDTVKALTQKGGLKSLLSGAATPAAAPTIPTTSTAPGGKGGGLGNMFKGIKTSDMIKGAAAVLILSAALFVAAKAFQEFAKVEWPAVVLGTGALIGLSFAVRMLGKGEKDIIKGAAAVAILGAALIPFTYSLSLLAGIDPVLILATSGALIGLSFAVKMLGEGQKEMIKGAIAVAILGAALIPFAYSMSLIAGLDMGAILAAAAGLLIFGAAVFGLGALLSGPGAILFGAGLLGIIALGGAMIVLGEGLKAVSEGGKGLTELFQSLTTLDTDKLNAIAPALKTIGDAVLYLGAGSVMSALGKLLGGDSPTKMIQDIAASGDGIQKAATGLQSMATALNQVQTALASIDVSKLEMLEKFASKMAISGAIKGITDFITAPIKAVGSMAGGGEGGGKDEAMIKAINEVRDAVNKLYNKDSSIKMDSKEVGTTLTQNTYKVA